MRGARGHCTNGYLERGQVGEPCVHVSGRDQVCLAKFLFIQITNILKLLLFCYIVFISTSGM